VTPPSWRSSQCLVTGHGRTEALKSNRKLGSLERRGPATTVLGVKSCQRIRYQWLPPKSYKLPKTRIRLHVKRFHVRDRGSPRLLSLPRPRRCAPTPGRPRSCQPQRLDAQCRASWPLVSPPTFPAYRGWHLGSCGARRCERQRARGRDEAKQRHLPYETYTHETVLNMRAAHRSARTACERPFCRQHSKRSTAFPSQAPIASPLKIVYSPSSAVGGGGGCTASRSGNTVNV